MPFMNAARADAARPAGLRLGQALGIASLFWLYVTVSNVLYGWSMRSGFAYITDAPLFAAPDARVMQHLFMWPMLLVSYWASLKVQWRPLLLTIPLQLILASVFAALAYPALSLSQIMLSNAGMHEPPMMLHEHATKHFLDAGDPAFLTFWLASFVNFLPAYGFGLALVTGTAIYARFRDSQLRMAALEREWSAARLAALRMQLSPHTLFNLLHTIRGYIEWDPKGAQSMVVQLADLLRRLLNAGERDFSRLTDEVHFARLYLELQQRRFVDRLQVELPEMPETPAVWVPSLILQPLIENAVVHGMAGHQGPVHVRVTTKLQGDQLHLLVTNTLAPDRMSGSPGIGLKNVRERVAVQFEGRATLTTSTQDGRWHSEVIMPALRESPPVLHELPLAEKYRARKLAST
jgi:AcrR family transcriptional regulator